MKLEKGRTVLFALGSNVLGKDGSAACSLESEFKTFGKVGRKILLSDGQLGIGIGLFLQRIVPKGFEIARLRVSTLNLEKLVKRHIYEGHVWDLTRFLRHNIEVEIVVPDEFKYLYVQSKDRPVVKIPNPVLRKVAQQTKITKKTDFLINEMMRAMRKASGIGLAAPQLGISQRVIVIAPLDYKPTALINPVIVKAEGEQIGQEGCLSIPGLYGDVKRADYVEVEALDRKGREITIELEGLPARVVQHEIDHLEGILFIDKVDIATLHWTDPEAPDTDEV
jgi:peptide deformylase